MFQSQNNTREQEAAMKFLVGFIVGALLVSIYMNYEPQGSGEASVSKAKERIWSQIQPRES